MRETQRKKSHLKILNSNQYVPQALEASQPRRRMLEMCLKALWEREWAISRGIAHGKLRHKDPRHLINADNNSEFPSPSATFGRL
jgi:hypothetical protein